MQLLFFKNKTEPEKRTSENWHVRRVDEVFLVLSSSEQGLGISDAEYRKEVSGKNALPESKRLSPVALFFKQFKSPLIFILLFAGVAVVFLGDTSDAIVITVVLLFNATVGSFQERRSQNAFAALQTLLHADANVVRNDREMIIKDEDVVPGDILVLREGMRVSADARVFASESLRVDEASLTGESNPVFKIVDPMPAESSLADRKNMVFKGTVVVSGAGRAIVVETGRETALGKVGEKMSSITSGFPMKQDLQDLSKYILIGAGIVALMLSVYGLLAGMSLREIFGFAVAVSVSIIPEGLPVVLTFVLAIGVRRMSEKQVLVKNLQAVEAMGQIRVLALDKTGTITRNELVVRSLYAGGKLFEVSGEGYDPEGTMMIRGKTVDAPDVEELTFSAKAAAFSSDAHVVFSESESRWTVSGDPTEAALLIFAKKAGFDRKNLDESYPKIDEKAFDYSLKYRSSIREFHGGRRLFVSGAPETILKRSAREWTPHGRRSIDDDARKRLEETFLLLSRKGLRVIAFGMASLEEGSGISDDLPDLDFIAFVGMSDSLREGVPESIAEVMSAGIRAVLITGDHRETAESLAIEAGLFHPGDTILTGEDLDRSRDEDLLEACKTVKVFARVTPEHKLRIITLLRHGGNTVAMTGDGVNDALSLVAADVGISMGNIGTEVAKEAADIVLVDDNFRNIVSGAEEGRNVFRVMRRVILYLFSASLGEALVLVGAIVLGLPLPILATQILWLNLVTDGFLDMALALEPKRHNTDRHRASHERIALIDSHLAWRAIFLALPMAVGTLFLFSRYAHVNLATAWTVSLVSLALFQWITAWNVRSERRSLFGMNPFSNPFLVGATLLVIALQIAAVYVPFFQTMLHTVPLGMTDWMLVFIVSLSAIFAEELRKLTMFFLRKRNDVR